MSKRISGKVLAVALVWLVLLGVGAAVFRYWWKPGERADVVGRSGSASRFSDRVRLSLDSFSGYSVFRSKDFENELATHSIGLELFDDKADYAARIRSLEGGDTDMAVFTVDALLIASGQLGRSPGTIVMVIDETVGADAMVAYKKAVPNIDALNRSDARFVVTRDSPSETLARVVMSQFNLPELGRQPWIDADGAEDVYEKFRAAAGSDQPRAYVLWEPHVSKALRSDDAHVLIDSSNFSGYIVDVLVARRDFLLKDERIVRTVVESYLRSAHQARQESQNLARLVADDARLQGESLSDKDAEKLAGSIWWKNTQENYAHLGVDAGSSTRRIQHMDNIIRSITAVLLKTGAVSSDPTKGSPHDWYYKKILADMHQSDFHPGLLRGVAGADVESVRPAVTVRPLTEGQWKKLTDVGTLDVERIVFGRQSARLTGSSRAALTDLATTLERFPTYYLVVRGNARNEGDIEANRRLAEQRAQAAAEFLKEQGTPAHRLRAESTEPSDAGGAAQTVTFVLGQRPY